MKDILIYGFGGFGHEVACLLQHINNESPTWNLVGYIDDGVEVGTECKYGKVLGNIDTLNAWDKPINVVIAIGNVKFLETISSKITNPNVEFPNLIAPNCFFFDKASVVMGKGNIITFGCRMSCNIHIGDFNILNGCVSFGHDVVLGSYNVMFPETRISGQVTIGDKNFFGARCFASQTIKIGNENRFGAGTFVLRKIKDGALYMGNPAKKVDID
ncbi:MAG: serine acetyltransferase [Bacteroidales bacterium]|nr:serine acetyltransferase [Bacteroidales bacterium]